MAAEGNVALAFGLVVAAGACTCIGALLVFCVAVTNTKWLSAALGASAGVMTYVSMVEIFSGKAIGAFQSAGFDAKVAARYATFAFFLGMLVTWLLDKLVHALSGVHDILQAAKARRAASGTKPCAQTADAADPMSPPPLAGMGPCCGCAGAGGAGAGGDGVPEGSAFDQDPEKGAADLEMVLAPSNAAPANPSAADPSLTSEAASDLKQHDHAKELGRMGLLAALAIGLHNLPEGLATFIAALASPSAGIAIAVAIALHNIPEGVAVAMPIYYATGSKWKAFGWSAVSAAAEPVGGLLGYTILAGNGMHPLVYGIMFAVVAGMMVYISIRELLPTALRYDPEDTYATACFIGGCAVMAASLLLFAA